MTVYVALLRGVNVGGAATVSMPRLRELLAEAGLADVATYVNSGNVVASAGTVAGGADGVAAVVREVVREGFGVETPVMVRTGATMARVRDAAPFPGADPSRVGVLFGAAPVPAEGVERLRGLAADDEEVATAAGHVVIHCPGGFGRSKLAGRAKEPMRGVPVTVRNLRTVGRLAGMAADRGDVRSA